MILLFQVYFDVSDEDDFVEIEDIELYVVLGFILNCFIQFIILGQIYMGDVSRIKFVNFYDNVIDFLDEFDEECRYFNVEEMREYE